MAITRFQLFRLSLREPTQGELFGHFVVAEKSIYVVSFYVSIHLNIMEIHSVTYQIWSEAAPRQLLVVSEGPRLLKKTFLPYAAL